MLKKICKKFRLDGYQTVSALTWQGISDMRSMIAKIATSVLLGKQATRMPIAYLDVWTENPTNCGANLLSTSTNSLHLTPPHFYTPLKLISLQLK